MIVSVTCSVIIQNGHLLIAQRKADDTHSLKWELPGGKVEAGETNQECLIRELKEELDITVRIGSRLPENVHRYGHKEIRLIPFFCEIVKGKPKPLVHEKIEWVPIAEALSVDWAEADIPIINWLLDTM